MGVEGPDLPHRYYDNKHPGVWDLGLGVEGLGWVYGLGFRVLFLGFGVQGWGFISELPSSSLGHSLIAVASRSTSICILVYQTLKQTHSTLPSALPPQPHP